MPATRRPTPALLLVLLLALSLAAVAAPAPAVAAAPAPTVGVHVHALWGDYDDDEVTEVMSQLAAAGVRAVRVDVGWSSFQGSGPSQFSSWWVDRMQRVLDRARAHGLEVLAVLHRTPDWANGGAGVATPPHDPADFARFAGRFAATFAGDVHAYQIWNEPNHRHFFRGTAAAYARLLKAAYPAIHRADPDAVVVLGGPAYNDTGWLTQLYAAGAAGSFDVLSTHPYQSPGDLAPETIDPDGDNIWLLTHVEAVRALMLRHGDGDVPIWFTEFGWASRANTPGLENYERGVSEAVQAEYLVRTLDLIADRYPYVTRVFWYNARERDTGDARLDGYGLLRRDLSPKPALLALRRRLAEPASARVPIERVAGRNRVETAIAAADRGWAGSRAVVLARADDPADALTGSTLAASLDAPLLLTDRRLLDPAVAAQLRTLGVERAYLLGGRVALEPAVEAAVRDLGIRVERVAGADRAGTAAAVARRVSGDGGTVLLARGLHRRVDLSWPDVLTASAYAVAGEGGAPLPVLLFGDDLPAATSEALRELRPGRAIVIGTRSTVPARVLDALRARSIRVETILGGDPYAASLRLPIPVDGTLVLATGERFPDALSGGALASRLGGRLLLLPDEPSRVPTGWLRDRRADIDRVVVLGGESAVPQAVVDAVRRALS